MNYDQLENEILEKLAADIDDVKIEQSPENPVDYVKKMTHPHGAIVVGYARSTFEKPDTAPLISQPGRIEIDLTLTFRSLRGHHGIYETMEKTQKALIGFKMSTTKKTYLVNESFADYMDGIWVWNQTFAFNYRVTEE